MANEATGRDSDKFMLRLPDGMRDRLRDAAAANGRSMNAEIVQRLEGSFTQATLDRSNLTEEQRRNLGRVENALGEILGSLAISFAEQNRKQEIETRGRTDG